MDKAYEVYFTEFYKKYSCQVTYDGSQLIFYLIFTQAEVKKRSEQYGHAVRLFIESRGRYFIKKFKAGYETIIIQEHLSEMADKLESDFEETVVAEDRLKKAKKANADFFRSMGVHSKYGVRWKK